MDLLLIRHGLPRRVEGASGPADPPLAAEGIAQASALADWLHPEPLDAVYVSPMRRARQTADPIAARYGIDPVVEPDVAEFDRHAPSYVPMEQLKAEGDPRWQEIVDGDYFAVGGIEPEAFYTSVVAAIEKIIDAHRGGTAAVVCHGGVINVYLAHILGLGGGPDRWLFFEPGYTSVSRVRASGRGHRSIVTVNETGHLRGPGRLAGPS